MKGRAMLAMVASEHDHQLGHRDEHQARRVSVADRSPAPVRRVW